MVNVIKENKMFNIFKSKQKREAEALAKLKEEERKARLARNMPPQRNPSSSYVDDSGLWAVPLEPSKPWREESVYYSDASAFVKANQTSYNSLSEGSGSFSGAGASSSWNSSSIDDSSSRSCSSSSYSSSYSSNDSYSSSDSSSSSSDSSSSCSSSD
jgi:hypothetical protein